MKVLEQLCHNAVVEHRSVDWWSLIERPCEPFKTPSVIVAYVQPYPPPAKETFPFLEVYGYTQATVIVARNNRWNSTDNTPTSDNKGSYRSKGPVIWGLEEPLDYSRHHYVLQGFTLLCNVFLVLTSAEAICNCRIHACFSYKHISFYKCW